MTPEEIATILEIPYFDDSWGFSFRFERGADAYAFIDLCDEQGAYAVVPSDRFDYHAVIWYVEESEAQS